MRTRAAGLAVAAGLSLLACGDAADTIAEEAAERASDEDVDVDIDSDDGSVSIDGEDGSIEISNDLPDEYADLPFPDDYEYQGGTVSSETISGEEQTLFLGSLAAPGGTVDEVGDVLVDFYQGEGWTVEDADVGNLTVTDGDRAIVFVITSTSFIQFYVGDRDFAL